MTKRFILPLGGLVVLAGTLAWLRPAPAATDMEPALQDQPWAVFGLSELRTERDAAGRPYLPFFNAQTLRMGLYTLAAGATDDQQPHTQDEAYYVISGKAMFEADGESRAVGVGDVIYVKAHVDHRFFEIEETLELLVFFSTADPDKTP